MKKFSFVLILILVVGLLQLRISSNQSAQTLNSHDNNTKNMEQVTEDNSVVWADYWNTRTATQY